MHFAGGLFRAVRKKEFRFSHSIQNCFQRFEISVMLINIFDVVWRMLPRMTHFVVFGKSPFLAISCYGNTGQVSVKKDMAFDVLRSRKKRSFPFEPGFGLLPI